MAGAPNFQSLDGALLGITREERGKVELEVEVEETEDFERGGMDGLVYGEDGFIKFTVHTRLRIRSADRRLKTFYGKNEDGCSTYAENVGWFMKICEAQTAVEAQNPRRHANPPKENRWTWASSQETSHPPSPLEVDTDEEDGCKNLRMRFATTRPKRLF
ncbi:hypothetical protein B0H14DRAFT_2637283 [Mycena olivaceomarginata]|nr:hypothetical protein B0H14DRAFT_2637283 [Mycena olivaceomarginata]